MSEIDRYVEQLVEEGYAIIPAILPPAEIERTKEAIDTVLESAREIASRYGLQNENLQM